MLFSVAVGLALSSGKLRKSSQASAASSHKAQASYALMGLDGSLIARFPLEQVLHSASQRERMLNRLEGRRQLEGLPIEQRRARYRARPERERALAWAISRGQPVPPGHFGVRELLIAGGLLLLGLLPGIVFLIWALPRGRRYQQAIAVLLRQWRAAGTPDPIDEAFLRLVGR